MAQHLCRGVTKNLVISGVLVMRRSCGRFTRVKKPEKVFSTSPVDLLRCLYHLQRD